MVDDGEGDDGVEGNGVYGADIPPRADREVIAFWIDAAKIRQLAVVGFNHAYVFETELCLDIGHPAPSKAFPSKRIDAAGTKQ